MHVYFILNNLNWKYYIGKTKESDLARYWSNQKYRIFHPEKSCASKPHLYNAVRKYGWENFTIRSLRSDFASEEECLAWEQIMVRMLAAQKCGYNICAGGRGATGWKPSAETRAKISASNKGKKRKPLAPEQEACRLAGFRASVKERIASGSYHGSQEAVDKIKKARAQQDESQRKASWEEWYKRDAVEYHRRCANTHRGKKHQMSSSGSIAISEAFKRSCHKRWHVNRGLKNSTCNLCSEGI